LLAFFDKAYFDRSIRVIVLRGAEGVFCAGLDLKTFSGVDLNTIEWTVMQRRFSEIVMRMRRCSQPIVALIDGPATGGGFALALAADVRIATDRARMNCAFVKVGLSGCEMGVSYMLTRLIGVSVASELMMTGRFINADRALAVGLISEIVAPETLETAGEALVAEMLALSPLGLRLTKECINASVDPGSLGAAIAMEDRNQILCIQAGNLQEGISAFLEKRPTEFRDN
jgi:enoyl-CoA hydratase/carnithine racemase